MGCTSKKQIAGHTVELYELSVADVRNWLKKNAETANTDLVDVMLFDDFVLSDLALFSDLKPEVIETLTPTELREAIDEIKVLNPHFFGLRGRLVTLGSEFQKSLQNESKG